MVDFRGIRMFVPRNCSGYYTFLPTTTNTEGRKVLLNGVFAVNKIKNLTSVEVLETVKEILLRGYYYYF
jgi:hypothetical protein